MFSQRRFRVNNLSLSRYPTYTAPFSVSFPNISSQSRPRSHRCSCPAESKKDGGKVDYDACADSYQSQTVKKNEKSLKLDGATSSVMFFGRRGKIKTFSGIPRIDFPFYLSTQTQSTGAPNVNFRKISVRKTI